MINTPRDQFKVVDTLNSLPLSVKCAGGLAVCLGAAALVRSKVTDFVERRKLHKAITRRQAERSSALQKLKNKHPFTLELQAVVELPMESLIVKLQTRELLATKVLSAFIAKTLEVNDEFNCVTELVPQAFDWARELDTLQEVRGPLHGIPICVKDDTDLVGMDTTVGLVKNLGKPATESAVLVQALQELGAVPFCKTNLPQLCCSNGSHNPIYGRTLNPHNKKLSPGGSSSGTGCLVAAGGVPFGTGTDTGGSLRTPAHFNGISTLKPTKDRLSRKGLKECVRQCIGFTSVGFVLAKYPSEVAYVFKGLTENNLQNRYDGRAVPIPWNESAFSSDKPLRIGYFTTLKEMPAVGDIEETVLRAKSVLESLGHTVVPFQIPEVNTLMGDLMFADMGKRIAEDLKFDTISPTIAGWYGLATTPVWKRRLLTSIPLVRRWFTHLEPGLRIRLSSELWAAMAEREALGEDLLERMDKLDLDLILCPPLPCPAVGAKDADHMSAAGGYATFFNLVDFPAGVVRFGTETGKNYQASRKIMRNIYNVDEESIKNAVGMPIGVQLVGKPYQEEVVLRGMVILHKHYEYQSKHIGANRSTGK